MARWSEDTTCSKMVPGVGQTVTVSLPPEARTRAVYEVAVVKMQSEWRG